MDSAAAASKAARATEHESDETAVAASQLELAAYSSGTLSYLASGRDLEAVDLSQHVSLPPFSYCYHINPARYRQLLMACDAGRLRQMLQQ